MSDFDKICQSMFVKFFDTGISSLILSGSMYLKAMSCSDTSLYSGTTAFKILARK